MTESDHQLLESLLEKKKGSAHKPTTPWKIADGKYTVEDWEDVREPTAEKDSFGFIGIKLKDRNGARWEICEPSLHSPQHEGFIAIRKERARTTVYTKLTTEYFRNQYLKARGLK